MQIQSKISAVVQRITANDLVSQDSREKFIASLPPHILGTVGGNTACVELQASGGASFILDAGSGLRSKGLAGDRPQDNHYYLFLSHLHWDHIQGFPFFPPVFDGQSTFDCYSASADARGVFAQQMSEPAFPIKFDVVDARMKFHTVEPGEAFHVGGLDVSCCMMKHPGGSTAFSFTERATPPSLRAVGEAITENGQEGSKKFVYATDVELRGEGAEADSPDRQAVFADADCIVLDSQYTVAEAFKKGGWGHSAFCYAVDFAAKWNIKDLYLFHHEPAYNDKKLYSILQTARWYAKYIERTDVHVHLAREGLEVQI